MQINYYGLGCFRLQIANASILIEPAGAETGLKLPRMQNDVVIYTKPNAELVKSGDFVISSPGEYEVKSVFIYGQYWGKQVAYIIEVERVRLAYLGPLKKKSLTNEQLEFLDGVDVLFVPVGGGTDLATAEEASDLVSAIEPRVIIPMYYQIPGVKIKLADLADFKKQSGATFEEVDKLKLTKDLLPTEGEKYYELSLTE